MTRAILVVLLAAALSPLAASAQTPTPAAPAIDAVVWADQASASSSIKTAQFSTATGPELLLAFISSDGNAPTTVTGVTGGNLTWQLVKRTNAQPGTAEVWRAFAAAPIDHVTVKATLSRSVTSSMTVVSFSGVDASSPNGSSAVGAVASASALSGAPRATLTTTRANSWVFGVGTDWDHAIARTVGAGQTMVHQYMPPVGDTYWLQRTAVAVLAAGSPITINDTAPAGDRYNLTLVEVLPPSAPVPPPVGTVSLTAPGSNAVVNGTVALAAAATDAAGVAGVQFTVDGVAAGAEDTVAPYALAWDTTALANGPHVVSAVGRNTNGVTFAATPVAVTVDNDTTAPAAVITAPLQDAVLPDAAITVSASASDAVGVAGVQFFVDGAPLGPEDMTTPFETAWNTDGAAEGAHTLTARARDAAGNQTTTAEVRVTVEHSVSGRLAIDATAWGDQGVASTTVTTAPFSTGAPNELLLAFVASDGPTTRPTSVTAVSGEGLTWELVRRTNAQYGTAEIWRAFATSTLTNAAVTATLSSPVASTITVISVTGADRSGANGAGAIGATASAGAVSGAPSAGVTTTRAQSWVFGVGVDWDRPAARTLGAGQTLVHQYMPPVGDTYWVQRRTASTSLPGTAVTLDVVSPTTDRYNLTVVEILASRDADTTSPTVSVTTPATNATMTGVATLAAAASDDVAVGTVQFQLDGHDLGAPLTSAPYTLSWDSAGAADGPHVLTAVARDAAGNTATSAAVAVTVDNAATSLPPPTAVVFQASADHGVLVGYVLEVFAAGADPNVDTAFAASDLGLPAPDASGDISVDRRDFFAALPAGTYQMTVAAVSADGVTRSAPVLLTR